VLHADGSKFGCYDPYGDFKDDRRVATEQLFLPWEDVELSTLPAADEYSFARGRKVLVTIEPWSWSQDWNVSPFELRNLILSGRRDENLQAICRVLANFRSPLIIRWAQEMENPSGRFTWANWPAKDYIAAYKRMIDIVRAMLPNAQIMWSPKGEKNLQNYYPGDDYLDIVGLSVFGLEAYDMIEFRRPRSFAEILKQGYDLSAGYGKPIWVAELGYEDGLQYVAKWVQEATLSYPEFPQLKEVNYFNHKEVWPWPHNLGLPDWRVVRDKPTYPARESK
jgi:endoglucanase